MTEMVKYTREMVVGALKTGELVQASTVGDRVGCSSATARNRLLDAEDDGEVELYRSVGRFATDLWALPSTDPDQATKDLHTRKIGYREKCLQENDEVCHRCEGRSANMDSVVVHHIDGDRSNNSLDNLIPLCHSCHHKWHQTYEERMTFGAFESSFPDVQIDGVGPVLEYASPDCRLSEVLAMIGEEAE